MLSMSCVVFDDLESPLVILGGLNTLLEFSNEFLLLDDELLELNPEDVFPDEALPHADDAAEDVPDAADEEDEPEYSVSPTLTSEYLLIGLFLSLSRPLASARLANDLISSGTSLNVMVFIDKSSAFPGIPFST